MARITRERREIVFGSAVLIAGFAILNLCLTPFVFVDCVPVRLFPTAQQEKFFFDLFSIISGCWLLSWVAALNEWRGPSKVGQWLGIILLCVDQTIFLEVWKSFAQAGNLFYSGLWIAPTLVQAYLAGCFFGFFTMPALTQSGNTRLTGLGTLALIMPWLIGHDAVVTGTRYLNGLFY